MKRNQQPQWHWSVVVGVIVGVVMMMAVEVRPNPLSHQQQLRRRGISRGRSAAEDPVETTEPILVQYSAPPTRGTGNAGLERERTTLKTAEKATKAREQELEKVKSAFMEREKVLEEREFALDSRDAELDQRSNTIDKQVLETDKRLKERESRIAERERKLSERESEILKLAEQREQEMEKLSRERETAAQLREKALEDRERALEEREQKVEEREIRVAKRMEANRKRFQRRRELHQLDQRMGISPAAPAPGTKSPSSGRALKVRTKVAEVPADQTTLATVHHPKRIIEKVTLRKVTSAAPTTTSETTTAAILQNREGRVTPAFLSLDEQSQVTEAVAYESAKQYSGATSSPVKGETTVLQQGLVPVSETTGVATHTTGKKRKSGKRRARQRRQGHGHGHVSSSNADGLATAASTHHGSGRKHKVRKVVKRMGSDGSMVIIKTDN